MVARPCAGKPAGVLIIENKTLVASFIGAVLGISGFRVVGIAGFGPEALLLAGETRPALALVDIGLNGIGLNGPPDGAALACLLRDRLAIPATFLSGPTDPRLRRANAARPLGFIKTPCAPSHVFNAIERGMIEAATLLAAARQQAG